MASVEASQKRYTTQLATNFLLELRAATAADRRRPPPTRAARADADAPPHGCPAHDEKRT